jgi:hypothetical protein
MLRGERPEQPLVTSKWQGSRDQRRGRCGGIRNLLPWFGPGIIIYVA